MVFAAAALLLICAIADIITGPADLGLLRTLSIVLNPGIATVQEMVIVWELRLPVALMAIAVGAMLGVAGAEMQTILNNPLADPFTLGLSSAASFGAALATSLQWSIAPGMGDIFVTAYVFVFAFSQRSSDNQLEDSRI